MMTTLALSNLTHVRERIARAAEACGRKPADITLIAVSKTFGTTAVRPILEAGQVDFGENRVQEAQAKWLDLWQDFHAARLHLIGPLQTNKVSDAVALADAIHSLDRSRLAQALAAECRRQNRSPLLFIQVNTGGESQKAGVAPDQADDFIAECREKHCLQPVGLMCIPPVEEAPERHFELLRTIAERTGLAFLSMGMSGDFEAAVRGGATHVRVGSLIFGQR